MKIRSSSGGSGRLFEKDSLTTEWELPILKSNMKIPSKRSVKEIHLDKHGNMKV